MSKTWRVYKIFTNRRLKRQVSFVVYIFVCFLILNKSESEFNLVGDEDSVKICAFYRDGVFRVRALVGFLFSWAKYVNACTLPTFINRVYYQWRLVIYPIIGHKITEKK